MLSYVLNVARPDSLYTAIVLRLGKIYEGRIYADGPETVRQMQGLQLQKLILKDLNRYC